MSGATDIKEDYGVGDSYHTSVIKSLNDQRSDGKLCDVILVADGYKFPAHRSVLAAASKYFESMFEEDHFTESRNKEIELHSISKEALKVILDMIYVGKLCLTMENVHSVLAGTDHLLLNTAKCFCVSFMLKVLASEKASTEALYIRRSAEIFSLTDVQHQAELVIQEQFSLVSQSQSFLELSTQEIEAIIKSDLVIDKDELVLWKACIHWIRHNKRLRFARLDYLMNFIRFALIEPSDLIGIVRQHEWMLKSPICLHLIQSATEYQLQPKKQSWLQSPQTKPRCRVHDRLLYCISGLDHFKCYIPAHNRWYSLKAPPVNKLNIDPGKKIRLRLINLSGLIFLSVQTSVPEQVACYELQALLLYKIQHNEWKHCILPSGAENNHQVLIECNTTLYACSRKDLQKYDIDTNRWYKCCNFNLSPSQLIVSDENSICCYNLEDGIVQTIRMDKEFQVTKQVILTPNRFIMEVQGCTKLPNHEVFILLRTITLTGTTRKIFNVKTNQWRDCSISHGLAPIQPRAGVHYPLCIDPTDHWEAVSDRNENCLYVLATKSGLTDIPAEKHTHLKNTESSSTDGVLPFYKLDMNQRTWKRLACLPEFMGCEDLVLCMSDGQSTMATACSFS